MGANSLSAYEAECLQVLLTFYDRDDFYSMFGKGYTIEDVLKRLGEPSDPTLKAYYQAILHNDKLKNLELYKKADIDADQAQIVCFKGESGCVVAFEGTQMNAEDIKADIYEVGMGGSGEYLERARAFVESCGNDVIVVGHSLGGWLAKAVTYLCGNVSYCYAFNAPDFNADTKEYLASHSTSTIDAEARIRRIDNPHDTVHNINGNGKVDVLDAGNAVGALSPNHQVSTLGTMVLSSATLVRDYSDAKEQELINVLRGVSETKPDICENKNIFQYLWDGLWEGLTAFIQGIINGIHDVIWGSYDNMAREMLETEAEVHTYFERGRAIDAALPGQIGYLKDMIYASAENAQAIMPQA